MPAEYADLLQLQKENKEQYLAFLMWASDDAETRSMRRISRVVGRSSTGIRDWAKRFEWKRRVDQEDAHIKAARLLAQRQSPESREDMRGERPVEPPPKTMDEVAQHRAKYLKSLKIDAQILDQMLKVFAEDQLVTRQHMRVRPGDVPRIMEASLKMHRELLEWQAAGGAGGDGAKVVEDSFRVKQAKLYGRSVVTAMREDAEELTTILRAMEFAEERTEDSESENTTELKSIGA
jgi:hypothetical protein